MKKKYLLLGSLAFFQWFVQAQSKKDSVIEKIDKTEIDVVYNHYIQDGNNSAVTGGTGTEELTVYGPMLNVKKSRGNKALSFNLGADIISSASTDKIDFVKSSASILDVRSYANTTYEQTFEKRGVALSGGIGFSMESDYFSIGSKLGFVKQDQKRVRTYTAQFQMFNDDLRWGRISQEHFKPVKLIYPSELRYKEWYETTRRNSYNFKFGLSQAINKRNVLGIFPEFSYQSGLLATPFHRIYFNDGTIGVEQLPEERFRNALAIKLNSFIGGSTILKNTIQAYRDNFGIAAGSIETEAVLKINHQFMIMPNVRLYTQSGSPYFDEFKKHSTSEEFYTSDFDLSKLSDVQFGIGFKYNSYGQQESKVFMNTFLLRYSYLSRSTNLSAHIISLSIHTEFKKKKQKLM